MRFKELKRLIRISPLRNSSLYHAFRFEMKRKECEKVINDFLGSVSSERREEIVKNMKHAMVRYHWNFEEYFLFDYEGHTHEERLMFVPEYDKNVFCDQVNNSRQADVFYNKWETYKVFKDFFKRDAILVRGLSEAESDNVSAFVENHHSFIMKPLTTACGRGIQVVKAKSKEDAKTQLVRVLKTHDTAYIVEELICQVQEMAQFHPQSVNTVRIPTFNIKGEIKIVRPFMRTGCGNSVVDNAGSGGVFAILDSETGTVYAAADEYNNSYTYHPDSKKQIVGFTVPFWNDAIETAKNLSRVIPDVKYVGWDLALTNNGWVLVEGNDKGQFIFQYPLHEGFSAELDKLKKQM